MNLLGAEGKADSCICQGYEDKCASCMCRHKQGGAYGDYYCDVTCAGPSLAKIWPRRYTRSMSQDRETGPVPTHGRLIYIILGPGLSVPGQN